MRKGGNVLRDYDWEQAFQNTDVNKHKMGSF